MSSDYLPIAIRAYTEKPNRKSVQPTKQNDQPSQWSLVFDCETAVDAAQRLRFGAYQIRRGEDLRQAGLFYDADTLSPCELDLLQRYARIHGLACRTRSEFVDKVFLRYGYDRRATIIGFNLPFDISRLAVHHGAARKSMRGGFTFRLSEIRSLPHVRVKHLSRRAALFDFAVPPKQETPRGSRKRGIKTPPHRGFFVDVATLAAALMSQGFSLQSLCKKLAVTTPKIEGAEHEVSLTEPYLDYACVDVQATWECFVALRERYNQHGLTTPLHRIISEASIGKAYNKLMGAKPLLACTPDTPRDGFGMCMSAYHGGRAEVRWRRTIKRVLYCDFKSMYPTVNTLMGLWRFVIADGFTTRDATTQAQCLLEAITADDLQQRETWRSLTMLVRVRPDRDLFPARAKYSRLSPASAKTSDMHTIGVNYLTCKDDLWMTLADCIAAKLLSAKAPPILEAIAFEPGPVQDGLRPIDLFGDPRYRVDPKRDDVFQRLVDLRDDAKARGDSLEKAIKIIANATSYGIFIEVLRDDAPKSEPMQLYDGSGVGRDFETKAIEQPGRYFHPLLGVLITGAARLMLALAERKVLDAGLDWAFCDTDSIAIVKPDCVGEADFLATAQGVVDWFKPLNPYKKPGSILKMEDVNFALGADGKPTQTHAPLFCFAISAKRYTLFNLDEEGRPVIRKASAHGLGHLMPPYGPDDAPASIPLPAMDLDDIGVQRWQYDLWYKVIEAALAGHPDQVPLDYHPSLQLPAVSRFGISSPSLETWMRHWNADRTYQSRARPFGFMTSFQARKASPRPDIVSEAPKRGRPRGRVKVKPIAPFDRDPAKAAAKAFCRESGAAVAAELLLSYREALAQFHLHPEDKFLNGDFLDRGRTERRHVVATGVRLIGKEANKWEEEELTGEIEDVAEFGVLLH